MKPKRTSKNREFDIPEISRSAKLRPLHRRPTKSAKLPQEEAKLQLESHVLAWFRYEAERRKKPVDSFVNEALRQFMIKQVGDTELQANGLNPVQKAEVVMLINKALSPGKRAHLLAASSALFTMN